MKAFKKEYLCFFYAGVILLSACIIGIALSSTNMYNDIFEMRRTILLIPNILSYIFIIIGLMGYLNIFEWIANKRK